MRSIRLSLLVYFLGLLALALGVVSVLVYGITKDSLRAKNDATAKLIQKQYEELCANEQARLDTVLRSDAQFLVNQLHMQIDPATWQLAVADGWQGGGRRQVAGPAALLAPGPL